MDELSKWFPWCHRDISLEESEHFIDERPEAWESGRDYSLAIVDSHDASYLGNCSLYDIHYADSFAGLSYWVRTSKTKQGIATTATLLLARLGFEELKMNRLEIVVAVANEASQRVAEKAGAIREGIERSRFVLDGKASDAVMFSLIPTDLY